MPVTSYSVPSLAPEKMHVDRSSNWRSHIIEVSLLKSDVHPSQDILGQIAFDEHRAHALLHVLRVDDEFPAGVLVRIE